MKIFLDTANVAELREAKSRGSLDGVTTNPSLIAKEKRPFRELAEEICQIVDGPVNLEVNAPTAEGMVEEAGGLITIGKNVVIKVPLTAEGLKAVKILSGQNIRVNVTLCFNATQALFAAKAGASFISPFIGRLDDRGQEGMEVIEEIATIYDNYDIDTEILVASIRSPMHVKDAALIGAHIATMPFNVYDRLLHHPLTDLGLEAFNQAWKTVSE
ncbi:MAG: fructose-6-phosphate aldolase [Planctomycetota bacterium]|nr:fructose-6-phosphate aldolase [Planctomycetota bacterium]